MHETHLLGKIVLEMIENTEHSKSEILISCCHNQIRINYIGLYLIIIMPGVNHTSIAIGQLRIAGNSVT